MDERYVMIFGRERVPLLLLECVGRMQALESRVPTNNRFRNFILRSFFLTTLQDGRKSGESQIRPGCHQGLEFWQQEPRPRASEPGAGHGRPGRALSW